MHIIIKPKPAYADPEPINIKETIRGNIHLHAKIFAKNCESDERYLYCRPEALKQTFSILSEEISEGRLTGELARRVAVAAGMRFEESRVGIEIESRIIPCNKYLLNLIPFFHPLFNDGFKEAKEQTVVLKGISFVSFQNVYRYLEKPDSLLDVPIKELIDMAFTADYLGFKALLDECISRIEDALLPKHDFDDYLLLDICILSNKINNLGIENFCKAYIKNNYHVLIYDTAQGIILELNDKSDINFLNYFHKSGYFKFVFEVKIGQIDSRRTLRNWLYSHASSLKRISARLDTEQFKSYKLKKIINVLYLKKDASQYDSSITIQCRKLNHFATDATLSKLHLYTEKLVSLEIQEIPDLILSEVVGKNPGLKSFNCKSLIFKPLTIEVLAQNAKLEELTIRSSFPDASFRNLYGCRNIRVLHLDHAGLIESGTLIEFSKNCIDLTDVSLFGCKKISDEAFSIFIKNEKSLKKLELEANSISVKTCKAASESRIKDINFFKIENADEAIKPLIRSPGLEKLIVRNILKLDDVKIYFKNEQAKILECCLDLLDFVQSVKNEILLETGKEIHVSVHGESKLHYHARLERKESFWK